MTIESRIAALKTALAEKHADSEGDNGNAAISFLAGASALAEVERLRGRVECLMWLRDKKVIQPHVVVDDAHKLEALLKQMEEKV